RHGFEYFRHGTLSLYAAFNTRTGEVLGKTARRHTSAEFVAFLTDIVASQPSQKEIHVIADNLSAHKTDAVKNFLADHPYVHMHFTPTYSSWLNQVELWFAKIQRDVIARGVFTSVKDLEKKLMRYIRLYNKTPKTVKWRYFNPGRRIKRESTVTAPSFHQHRSRLGGVRTVRRALARSLPHCTGAGTTRALPRGPRALPPPARARGAARHPGCHALG